MNTKLNHIQYCPPNRGKANINSRRAFTLIELLVVIAVIAILAALLLPALASAKKHAQQVKCLSNVKELTLIGYMYATDSGSGVAYNDSNHPRSLWMGTDSYAKEKQILICPSTQEPSPIPQTNTLGAADRTWVWANAQPDIYTGSYAFNGWLYDSVGPGAKENPEYMMSKQSTIQKPSQTPVFLDAVWADIWPLETDPPGTDLYAGTWEPQMQRCTTPRHGGVNPAKAPRDFDTTQKLPGAINMGFADGHADLVKLENLWQCYWHLNWTPPAVRPQ